jgi:hypothetical protein
MFFQFLEGLPKWQYVTILRFCAFCLSGLVGYELFGGLSESDSFIRDRMSDGGIDGTEARGALMPSKEG